MAYTLRFVQRFRAADEAAFLALEARFAALERRKGWPRARRSRPVSGRDPVHTLVWECELETLAEAHALAARMAADPEHARLLKRQIPFFLEAWTEIAEVLVFSESRGRASRPSAR